MPSFRAAIDVALRGFPALLARLGVVDRQLGEEAFRLATPVMVGIALGGVAILVDLYAKGAVNTWRFASGRWQDIARNAELGTTPTD